jgi:hypothetical protein
MVKTVAPSEGGVIAPLEPISNHNSDLGGCRLATGRQRRGNMEVLSHIDGPRGDPYCTSDQSLLEPEQRCLGG